MIEYRGNKVVDFGPIGNGRPEDFVPIEYDAQEYSKKKTYKKPKESAYEKRHRRGRVQKWDKKGNLIKRSPTS